MREKTPVVTLPDKASLLQFLAEHDELFPDIYAVECVWLCDELDRFEKDGYVYNREAQDRICRENGISEEMAKRRKPGQRIRTDGGLLGSLIYNAQAYRRVRKLKNEGWQRATQELLAPFIGGECLALANGELGGEIVAKVKQLGEKIRLCPERSRTKAYADYLDWWIKPIVA